MKKTILYSFIITIILFNSCTPIVKDDIQDNTIDSLPYNQQVFYEVFPSIFDSLGMWNYQSIRMLPPPPPPSNYLEDDLVEYKRMLAEYEEYLKEMELDTLIPIIAIRDTAFYNVEKDIYYDSIELTTQQKSFRIDKDKLSIISDTFQLEYLSKVVINNSHQIKRNYRKRVKAVFALSSLYLDSNRINGYMYWSYACDLLCGVRGKIFIQKINNKWVIVSITEEWVS